MKKFICPHCLGEHQLYECMCSNANLIDIPSCFFESSDNVYIPIVGSRMTGKSVYAGVLAESLHSPNIRFAHDMSFEYFLDFFYEPLYEDNRLCDADAPEPPKPMMFEINSILHDNGFNKSISKYGMAIYDIQGQVFCEEEWLEFIPSYRRLIENANGVIFMIDPLQLDGIRKLLLGKTYLPPQNWNDTITIFRKVMQIAANKDKLPHIAFVLSKIDVLQSYGIIPNDWSILHESTYSSIGEISDQDVIQQELNSFLQRYAPSDICREIINLKNKSLWGVSSLGFTPQTNKLTQKISPSRVLDPLVWILKCNKKIPKGWL